MDCVNIGYFIVDRNENNIFYISTILSTITLFSVGVFAGKITKQSKTKNGFFTYTYFFCSLFLFSFLCIFFIF